MCGNTSGAMPSPESFTVSSASSAVRCSPTPIRPWRGVNFTALMSRFHSTCWRRPAAPSTRTGVASSSVSTAIDFASAAGRIVHLDRLQHPRPAEDAVQRRAQLVGHHGEELVLRAARGLRGLAREPLADEQLLALLLDASPLGDVTRDLRRADDAPGRITDRRDRDRHLDEMTVLRPAHGVEVRNLLAAAEPREHAFFLVASVVGDDQQHDWPPDGLGGRPAKHALRGAIPGRHDAVEILADDDVLRRVDDGGQARASLIEAPALADIPRDDRHAHDMA